MGGKVKLFHFDTNKLARNWKKTLPNVVYCSRFQPVQRSQCLAAPHRKPKERTDTETENKQVLQAWQRTAENSLNPAHLGSVLLQLQLFCWWWWWWWREFFLPSCRGEKLEFTVLERLPPLALECSRYRAPVCRGKGRGQDTPTNQCSVCADKQSVWEAEDDGFDLCLHPSTARVHLSVSLTCGHMTELSVRRQTVIKTIQDVWNSRKFSLLVYWAVRYKTDFMKVDTN